MIHKKLTVISIEKYILKENFGLSVGDIPTVRIINRSFNLKNGLDGRSHLSHHLYLTAKNTMFYLYRW